MEFVFSDENLELAKKIVLRYPDGKQRSSILPLLHLAQKQNENHISDDVIIYIANFLDLPVVKVKEVVTFYTMFNQGKVGRYMVQICSTLPCMLRNSEELENIMQKEFNVNANETTADKKFTFTKVECLGNCTNAPVVQINDDYHENMNGEKLSKLLKSLK